MKFPINDSFSKCDQIRSFLLIWSHLLKKSLMENCIFCAVKTYQSCHVKLIHFKSMFPFTSILSSILYQMPKAAIGGVIKKDVLKNFAKFTGKHLCQSLLRLRLRCFPVNFANFLKKPTL